MNETLDRVRSGELTQQEAARLLGKSKQWVRLQVNPQARANKRRYDRERQRRLRRDDRHRLAELERRRDYFRAYQAERLRSMTGVEYNRKLLLNRRWNGLKRVAERNARRGG